MITQGATRKKILVADEDADVVNTISKVVANLVSNTVKFHGKGKQPEGG